MPPGGSPILSERCLTTIGEARQHALEGFCSRIGQIFLRYFRDLPMLSGRSHN